MKRILLLIAVLALVAAACGGTADADEGVASLDDAALLDTPVTTAAAEMNEEEALLAFTQCLRDNGVDIEDPTVDAEGNLRLSRPNNAGQGQGQGGNQDFRAAREACSELLEGVTLGFQDVDLTEIEDQLLEFAMCMRDNGYENMPDPDLSGVIGGGQGGGPFGQLDRDDPDFQAAAEECQDILAGIPRGPGGGGRGGQGNG